MPDSWEFALSHAKGEYVTFLCDDDAMNPRLIETIAKIIKEQQFDVVCWRRHSYVHPDWYQPEVRNIFRFTKCSKRVIEKDSRLSLTSLCSTLSTQIGSEGPLMLNSACSRSIIELVKEKMGRFFLPPAPDYSTYVAVLAITEHYAFIDDHLMLGGSGKDSIGASSTYRGGTEAFSTYLKEFKGQPVVNSTPLRSFVVANHIAETILRVKDAMPNDLNDIDIHWQNYFVTCYNQLLSWRSNGTDISSDLREFWDALSKMPLSFQIVVRLKILKSVLSLIRIQQKVAHMDFPFRSQIGDYYRRIKSTKLVKGRDFGFSNILECARQLDDIQEHYS